MRIFSILILKHLKLMQPLVDLAASAAPPPLQEALQKIPETIAILEGVLSGGGMAMGVPSIDEVQEVLRTLEDVVSTLEQLQDTLDALG